MRTLNRCDTYNGWVIHTMVELISRPLRVTLNIPTNLAWGIWPTRQWAGNAMTKKAAAAGDNSSMPRPCANGPATPMSLQSMPMPPRPSSGPYFSLPTYLAAGLYGPNNFKNHLLGFYRLFQNVAKKKTADVQWNEQFEIICIIVASQLWMIRRVATLSFCFRNTTQAKVNFSMTFFSHRVRTSRREYNVLTYDWAMKQRNLHGRHICLQDLTFATNQSNRVITRTQSAIFLRLQLRFRCISVSSDSPKS